ncbi:HNH endonuclease [Marinobacter nauticus]|nr:HNH endonuclease [Marinobacter nauticus]
MPQRPLKPCSAPACRELVRGQRFCEKHQHLADQHKRSHDQRRGSSAKRGYGYKWQKARERFLQSHPLCIKCHENGRVKAATDVDHIVPHRGDMKLFWDDSNWQALCHSCHSEKTASEDSGFGNGTRTHPGAGQKF